MSEASAPPVSIVEFLTARLDEDEAQLDLAAEAEAESCRNDGMPDTTAEEIKEYWLRPGELTEWPRHLRGVAAKRAIIEYKPYGGEGNDAHTVHEEILCLLASVYSDHPDYREEWKP